jgi:hypothetical protein
MRATPLDGRNAVVLGVERPLGRAAAVALAEAGANVAVVTLTEATEAEFAANSVANEFWAMGRQGIVLTSDSAETSVHEAIADATAELGPVSIFVHHAPAPVPAETFAPLRSDPAVVVMVSAREAVDEARALLAWTRDLAAGGVRANAVVESRAAMDAVGPVLREHHPPQALDAPRAVVYLASDASAAIEGAVVVAKG